MGVPLQYLGVNCLIIDDEATMRQTVKNMLTRMGFKNIFLAENGKKALEFLKIKDIDVAICDINMPEMTGVELFNTLKENKKYDKLSFIFITAEARKDMIARAAEGAANDYIVKPFVMATLEDKMAKMLGKKFNPSMYDIFMKNFKQNMEAKKFDKAEEELTKASGLTPDNATVSYSFGQLALARGDVNAAISSFKQAIEIKPMYVKAYNSLGSIYESLGDIESALKYYKIAHSISPANSERLIALSKLYKKTGDVEMAETVLSTAQSDLREDASASLHLLGEMYLGKNENEKALETLLKAHKKNSSDITIMMSLAEAYRALNRPNDAIILYSEILKINSDNANAYYNMGKAYLELGEKESAINAMRKAWELNPFSSQITQDLRALAQAGKVSL
ncbi:MAG: tetratricopeptide repeat protein [Nitrospirae bacterium]|nr:tetratricopeptide repeat protein [Nitrospirota bacterium]